MLVLHAPKGNRQENSVSEKSQDVKHNARGELNTDGSASAMTEEDQILETKARCRVTEWSRRKVFHQQKNDLARKKSWIMKHG